MLLAGSAFTPDRAEGDDGVIVSTALARRFWGEADPIGRRFRLDPDDDWYRVVGVAADVGSDSDGGGRRGRGGLHRQPADAGDRIAHGSRGEG